MAATVTFDAFIAGMAGLSREKIDLKLTRDQKSDASHLAGAMK